MRLARLDSLGWHTVFESLIFTFKRLQILGHTYYNGKVVVIGNSSEDFYV